MPPPVPPTTPTGTAFPEADVLDLLLLPITMATTTARISTTATTAPMRTTLGPLFGVVLAIFLEASGRFWVFLLIRKGGGRGCMECGDARRARRHRLRFPHRAIYPTGTASERPQWFPRRRNSRSQWS